MLKRHATAHRCDDSVLEWHLFCADGCNIMDFRGKLKLNPATAKRQIKELQQQSLEPQQQQLLQQLSDYIRQHFNFEKENVN